MRKRDLFGFLILTTSLVGAQTLEGAKVTGLTGTVQIKVDRLWKAVKLGEQVAQDALLQLGEGAHLSLRYRSDGHREEIQGPGELKVGHGSGNSIVTSYGFRNRRLELPHSGGLDAVGGNIANASGGAKSTPLLRAAPTLMPAPATDRAMMPASPVTRPYILEPQVPEWTLAWQDGPAPSLVSTALADQLQVGAFEGEAVVMEGEQEVARLPVKGRQPVDLAGLGLREDTLYLVRLEETGDTLSTLSFRLLNEAERGELVQLVQQASVTKEQHQQRLDRFSALGQYHLAATECKRWLEDQKEPSAYLLQVVYDLNRDLLHDSRQTQYWKDWGSAHQLPLVQ